MNYSPETFDSLFTKDEDPWKFESRWYEQRKRDMTLACLPRQRYASGYEPGCANGVLSAALAERCDHLVVSDGSRLAVDLARRRVASLPNVEVREAWLPRDWPLGRFDLVVVSELGYFMGADDLAALASRVRGSLMPGGTVLACHWRWKSSDCEFDGDEVHRRLGVDLQLPSLLHLQDRDFVIDLWCDDPRSVAQREGLF